MVWVMSSMRASRGMWCARPLQGSRYIGVTHPPQARFCENCDHCDEILSLKAMGCRVDFGRDRVFFPEQDVMSGETGFLPAPKEQPPRKLSGKRTE